MVYADGTWGVKAKERYKRRLKAREFDKYYRRMGKQIPSTVDLSSIVEPKKCQICDKKDILGKWKGLLIHHKDGNNKNNCLGNLMLLCRGCHNRIHKTKVR